MNIPISMSEYGLDKHREIVQHAEDYWQAQLVHESRGQSSDFDPPRRTPALRRLAYAITTLFS
jgi:hypothetical protein